MVFNDNLLIFHFFLEFSRFGSLGYPVHWSENQSRCVARDKARPEISHLKSNLTTLQRLVDQIGSPTKQRLMSTVSQE